MQSGNKVQILSENNQLLE